LLADHLFPLHSIPRFAVRMERTTSAYLGADHDAPPFGVDIAVSAIIGFGLVV
jgi:hypothetical protein